MGVQQNSGRELGFSKMTTAIFVVWGLAIITTVGVAFFLFKDKLLKTTTPNQTEQLSNPEKSYTNTTSNQVDKTKVYVNQENYPEIPDEIYTKTDLTVLELPNNSIETLDAKIRNLKNLKVLNLTSNKISSLPEEIGELTSLEELFLASNKLTMIPPQIANLKSLKTLSLEGNYLSEKEMNELTKLLPNTKITFGEQNDPETLKITPGPDGEMLIRN